MNLDSELLSFRKNIIDRCSDRESLDRILNSLEEDFLFFLELKIGEDSLKKYVDSHMLPHQIFYISCLLILEKMALSQPDNNEMQEEWHRGRDYLESVWRKIHPEMFSAPYFRDNMTNDQVATECIKRVCYPIMKSIFEVRK